MGKFGSPALIDALEPRRLMSAIKYGVTVSGDPDLTGALSASAGSLKNLGAQGVRLFTSTSFLSSDFDVTKSGKIYIRKPSLQTSLSYAKKYHAQVDVTLCISLDTDHSMTDGSQLTDTATGKARKMTPSDLRSPKVFRAWYDTLGKAQISATDTTKAIDVVDFWEIGNEPGRTDSRYWPFDLTHPQGEIARVIDSYVDHDLIPAYDVLHAIHEPVVGAALGSAIGEYNNLNNQPGPRFHQYSDHCDYLNVHPYGILNNPVPDRTAQAHILDFVNSIYDDGTVKKPFVSTEYNINDYGHAFTLDPSANPRDLAEQLGFDSNLDAARTEFLNSPHVKDHLAYVYLYRLIADGQKQRGAPLYPLPSAAYTPLTPQFDLFRRWAGVSPTTLTPPASSASLFNIGGKDVIHSVAAQKDGKTLVATNDGVRRYDAKGKLDSKYGKSGVAKLPFIAKATALQGDGKLIVAGVVTDASPLGNPFHLVVTRLNPSGIVDSSFATGGTFALPDGSGSEAKVIALRAGRIVIAGRSNGFKNGIVIRLDLSGKVDPLFGETGITTLKGRGPVTDAAISKSGAITALVSPYRLDPQVSVVRLNNAGAADTTFSTDGVSDPQNMTSDGMFLNADGSVLVVGHTPLAARPLIARYSSKGHVDTTFGTNGVQTIAGKKVLRVSPIEAPDGTRYLFGTTAPDLTSDTRHVVVARLNAAYQIDPSFGTKGLMELSAGHQNLPFAFSVSPTSTLVIGAAAFSQADFGGMSEELIRVSL